MGAVPVLGRRHLLTPFPYPHSGLDMYHNEHTARTARLAAGGVVTLTSRVVTGRLGSGIALVRPPGHHACEDRMAGFCFLNSVAIAARDAVRRHGLQRVLIVDWDVHHGDGTQVRDQPPLIFAQPSLSREHKGRGTRDAVKRYGPRSVLIVDWDVHHGDGTQVRWQPHSLGQEASPAVRRCLSKQKKQKPRNMMLAQQNSLSTWIGARRNQCPLLSAPCFSAGYFRRRPICALYVAAPLRPQLLPRHWRRRAGNLFSGGFCF